MSSSKQTKRISLTQVLKLVNQGAGRLIISGVLLVLVATLSPFEFSLDLSAKEFANRFNHRSDAQDLISNILLFLPLGFGLTWLTEKSKLRGTLLLVLATSSALSLAVEGLQIFLPSRSPSPVDLLTNSLGGLLGFLSFRLGGARVLARTATFIETNKKYFSLRVLTVGFITYTALAVLVSIPLQAGTNLSNWDPSFSLLLGNEQTGDRPWRGQVSGVAIADRALSKAEVAHAFSAKISSVGQDSLLAVYELAGRGSYPDQRSHLPDLAWHRNPADPQARAGVSLGPSHWLETTTPATFATERISKTSQFSLSATVASADKRQSGPARIISLSRDPYQRNFTLGQENTDLSFRLRTPVTGPNGTSPELTVTDVFVDTNLHHLIITYDGATLLIYVDGIEHLHTFELTPGLRLFGTLISDDARNLDSFKLLYYGLVFIPLGAVLALTITSSRQRFWRRVSIAGQAILLASLVLELVLVRVSGKVVSLENLLLGMVLAASGMLLVEGQPAAMMQGDKVK